MYLRRYSVSSKTAISTQASSTAGMHHGSSDNSGSQYVPGNSWMSSSTKKYTATSTTPVAYSTPSHGSGISNWGNSGYNDCVQRKSISPFFSSNTIIKFYLILQNALRHMVLYQPRIRPQQLQTLVEVPELVPPIP